MLRAAGISLGFQGLRVLDDVSLELRPGEILGLIGPNGAGKTSLLNVLSGFQRPNKGSIQLHDKEIVGWSSHRVAREGIVRTFQGVRPFPEFSVSENIEVSLAVRGLDRAEVRTEIRSLLDLVGLNDRAEQRAAELPYGPLRLLGLARALAADPKYLLIDEPAAGLAEADAQQLRDILRLIRERTGCGVLVIEHNMPFIMQLCDRVQVLNRGNVLAVGTPAQVKDDPAVRRAYLGESSSRFAQRVSRRSDRRALLEVDQLAVSYGSVPALHDVSLYVGEGELVAAIGPNGAGKSTMMQAIAGLVRPHHGSIVFDGRSILDLRAEERPRVGVALVPEGRGVFPALSVGENLAVGAGLRTGQVRPKAAPLFDRFPILRERFDAPAGSLSGGERQQLAIARALMSRPRLLLLDEPSLGLAPKMIESVYDVLADMNRDGLSILVVEQNAERALAGADRAYVLRGGAIRLQAPAAELLGRAAFDQAYFGYEQCAA